MAVVYAYESFFIFGGFVGHATQIIARCDRYYQWSEAGRLNRTRYWHGVIVVDGQFLVIGGRSNSQTERCTIADNEITCFTQAPSLSNCYAWPGTFLVEFDYCLPK